MKKLLLLLFFCSFLPVEAQQSSCFRIGIEYGTYEMAGEIDDRWEFRQIKKDYPTYDSYSGSENVIGEGEARYAGLKSELSMWDNRLTLASGLRYTRINEHISPARGSQLYLFHQSKQGVELFRLYGMKESLGYVSIPLEADILLWGRLSNWQTYVKGGIQAGIKVHGNTGLDFVSRGMEKYENEILSSVGKSPSDFFSYAYGGIGLRLILNNGTRLAIEGIFPPAYLSKGNFSLLDNQSFGGVQFLVSTPINLFSGK